MSKTICRIWMQCFNSGNKTMKARFRIDRIMKIIIFKPGTGTYEKIN